MSSTNKTTNYQLSQFIGSDVPAWLVDYNGDMGKIDTAIKGVDTKAEQGIADASTADAKAVQAQTTANTAVTNAETAQNTANSANALATGNASEISDINATLAKGYGSLLLNIQGNTITSTVSVLGTFTAKPGHMYIACCSGRALPVTNSLFYFTDTTGNNFYGINALSMSPINNNVSASVSTYAFSVPEQMTIQLRGSVSSGSDANAYCQVWDITGGESNS